jgi:hypothetical protein
MIMDCETGQTPLNRRRKLTIQDAEAIAKLIVKQKCTETDAAIALQIPVHQWFSWKNKGKRSGNFATLLTRIRETKLSGLIDRIEAAGNDRDMMLPNGKSIIKAGDWRALAWLADKEARFAPQQVGAPANVTIQIGVVHDQLKRIFSDEPKLLKSGIKMPVRKKPVDV